MSYFVFYDIENDKLVHKDFAIVEYDAGYFDQSQGTGEPPHMDPIFFAETLDEDLTAIMSYLHEQFPDGWEIENGKVVSRGRDRKEATEL